MNGLDKSKSSEKYKCILCGHVPSESESTNCIHRGEWHNTFSSCTPRCGWGLGVSKLGQCHYSCCFSTDYHSKTCRKNPSHEYTFHPRSSKETENGQIFGKSDCPRYVVNLDADPKDRWTHIVKDYLEFLPDVTTLCEDVLGSSYLASIASMILSSVSKAGMVYYGEELKGIAKASGISLGRVIMLQIAYEAFSACTSIIVNGPDNYPLHIRTMDWDMPELKKLTIEVDFIKNGNVLYTATTWAGYVGVLTGLRPGGYSVSVNYRRTELGDNNIISGILTNMKRGVAGHWPVSFLVRDVLETRYSFDSAVGSLSASELMAPVYLTICGTCHNEGLVLTRDRQGTVTSDGVERCISERLNGNGSSIVQANMDIDKSDSKERKDDWQDICYSRLRRDYVKRALNGLKGPVTINDLWSILSTSPGLAYDTVYTTSMTPKTGELVTRVDVTDEQRSEAFRMLFSDIVN